MSSFDRKLYRKIYFIILSVFRLEIVGNECDKINCVVVEIKHEISFNIPSTPAPLKCFKIVRKY